jgi:hypothetical protein
LPLLGHERHTVLLGHGPSCGEIHSVPQWLQIT